MLKRLINQAIIQLEITPRDPLLIKSGQPTLSGAKLAFVRTYRFPEYPKEGWAYLPGSSLKGVLRSFAEKVCRTIRPTPTPVCLPYQDPEDNDRKPNQDSCGLILKDCKKKNDITSFPSADVYRVSCPICRLFGSHGFTGRLSVSDAYAQEKPKLEIRDGVAIDRFTGGTVPGHIFTSEVLTEGTFCTTLEVRNFERWMLGLLSLILEEMADKDFGQITLGSGKSRGLGRFLGIVRQFHLVYYLKPPEQLTGLYGLCPQDREVYDFFAETADSDHPLSLPEPQAQGLRLVYDIKNDWSQRLMPAKKDFQAYIDAVNWPGAIREYVRKKCQEKPTSPPGT